MASESVLTASNAVAAAPSEPEPLASDPTTPPPPPPPKESVVASLESASPSKSRTMSREAAPESGPASPRPLGRADAPATSTSTPATAAATAGRPALTSEFSVPPSRLAKFERILGARQVDLNALRDLAWNGTPSALRPRVWSLLLGYRPTVADREASSLARKRAEYRACVGQHFRMDRAGIGRTETEQVILRQILVDAPRTAPGVPLVHTPWLQRVRGRGRE